MNFLRAQIDLFIVLCICVYRFGSSRRQTDLEDDGHHFINRFSISTSSGIANTLPDGCGLVGDACCMIYWRVHVWDTCLPVQTTSKMQWMFCQSTPIVQVLASLPEPSIYPWLAQCTHTNGLETYAFHSAILPIKLSSSFAIAMACSICPSSNCLSTSPTSPFASCTIFNFRKVRASVP
jgi:hypothetical protein